VLFIVFGLFFVGSVQLSIAPYQLGWSLEARTWYLLAYLILEGFGATLVYAGQLPALLEVGAKAGHADEAATNMISTIFSTFGNLGGIVGPAVGAPMLSVWGFRTAIAVWGCVSLVGCGVLALALAARKVCAAGQQGQGQAQVYERLSTTDAAT